MLYERYARSVVVYADYLICRYLLRRFDAAVKHLIKQNRLKRTVFCVLKNKREISASDYNFFQNLVLTKMNEDGIAASVYTVQFNYFHEDEFDKRLNKCLSVAYESTSHYRRTIYDVIGAVEEITQMECDRTMTALIEIMRESLLFGIRQCNSDNSYHSKYIHSKFKQALLDYINEFMIYISPQGEEIYTLQDWKKKAANEEYSENTLSHDYFNEANIYAIKNNNKHHPLYLGDKNFLREEPVLGEKPVERYERLGFGEGFEEEPYEPDVGQISSYVLEQDQKTVNEAIAKAAPYMLDPELGEKDPVKRTWYVNEYTNALYKMNEDESRLKKLVKGTEKA